MTATDGHAPPPGRLLLLPAAVAASFSRRRPWHYDELRSECGEALARALARFDPARCHNGAAGLPGWCHAACVFAARARLRRLARRREAPLGDDAAGRLPARCEPPGARAERADEARAARALVAKLARLLRPRHYEALRLRFGLGLAEREVGERMNVSKQRARQLARVALGRARLVLGLDEAGAEGPAAPAGGE